MASVLLAEDTAATRAAIMLILQSAGHSVETAADGESAIACFSPERHDLAVLDIWLPKQSGLDVLRFIRDQRSDFPVVVMSGGGPGATLEQASLMADLYRADRILYKPFDDEELLGAIRDLLDSRRAGGGS